MIKVSWETCASIFEMFIEEDQPELGWRLRVKQNLPIPLQIPRYKRIVVGWVADAPLEGACAHLYARSPMQPRHYIGGPVSYMNWCESKFQSVHVLTPLTNLCEPVLPVTMCTTKKLDSGQELLWDYGLHVPTPPEFELWFNPEVCFLMSYNVPIILQLELNIRD